MNIEDGELLKRVIWIVLDSVGMGEMPDSAAYGDKGVNTIAHVYKHNNGLQIAKPYTICRVQVILEGMEALEKCESPIGTYARLAELSRGKDTTTGHWEMIGIHTEVPFPTYSKWLP